MVAFGRISRFPGFWVSEILINENDENIQLFK